MTTIVTRAVKGSPLSWVEADANFTNLNTDKAEVSVVDLKAPIASPDLTGVPTAPTATNGTNTTQLATTAFVQGKTAAQTPSTATGNISATNVQSALAELDTEKAALSGATFSGQVTATTLQTGVSGTNTNNFRLDASAADGTMKLARGDGQDIMTVDAAGKVAFPQNLVPALSAKLSGNMAIATGTQTVKLALTNYDFDTNGILNGGTYQVKPLVAGYYQVDLVVQVDSSSANQISANFAKIYKNGSQYLIGNGQFGDTANPSSQTVSTASALIFMNGTTDYLEAYTTTVCGTTCSAIANNTTFCVHLVRAS